jgi:hypothetical protein
LELPSCCVNPVLESAAYVPNPRARAKPYDPQNL